MCGSSSSPSGTVNRSCGYTPSGLSSDGLSRYTRSLISWALATLASPGMPPIVAQEPKATSTLLFWRSSLAMYSFSLLRTQPLNRQRSMKPSS